MTHRSGIAATIGGALLLIALLYGSVLLRPNAVLFTTEHDGLKNYYNSLYHIKHGTSIAHFSGMHYPYGEYLPFVDCHPFISNCLRWVSQNIVDLSNYTVGLLNLGMLLSLVLCAVFLFLILARYKIPSALAAASAVSITVLSSQPLLWEFGHYALSQTWFFPAAWYLLIRHQHSSDKFGWSVLIAGHTLFWFFTHNYLGLIILGTGLGFHLARWLFMPGKISRKHWTLAMGIQILVPLLIIALVWYADPHEGRIDMHYNVEHRAALSNIFLPNYSFLRPVYGLLFDLDGQMSMPWSRIGTYIGLIANLTLLFALVIGIKQLVRKKIKAFHSVLQKLPGAMLAAASLLLLFSMAIPFRWGLQWLLDWVPMLKQFVGLGRFAWPFFYVITVSTIIFLYHFFPTKKWHYALVLSASALMLAEGLGYHLRLGKSIDQTRNLFSLENALIRDAEIDISNYQAILPLPFYHKGITPGPQFETQKSLEYSMQLSYETGLPLVAASLSRPSLSEGKRIMQLFAPGFYTKPIEQDFRNRKPLLVLYTHEELKKFEQPLFNQTNLVHAQDSFELRLLPLDTLFNFDASQVIAGADSTYRITQGEEPMLASDTTDFIYFDNFDSSSSREIYRGAGALQLLKHDDNLIYQSKPGQLAPRTAYNLRFWFYNHLYDQSFSGVHLLEKNARDSIVQRISRVPINGLYFDGHWVLNDIDFTVSDPTHRIELWTSGSALYADSIYLDELLIRESDSDVFISKEKDWIMKNNEWVPLQ